MIPGVPSMVLYLIIIIIIVALIIIVVDTKQDSPKNEQPGFAQSGSLFRFKLLYIGTQDGIQVYPCSSLSPPLHSCSTLYLLLFEHGLSQSPMRQC